MNRVRPISPVTHPNRQPLTAINTSCFLDPPSPYPYP